MGRARLLLVGLVLVYLAIQTHRRIPIWKDDWALWSDAAITAPCRIRPHAQLAELAEAKGQPAVATRHIQVFIQIALDHTCPAY